MNDADIQENKNWYSRGYLPHYDNVCLTQSITFRLADSLPQKVLDKIVRELNNLPPEKRSAVKRKNIEK